MVALEGRDDHSDFRVVEQPQNLLSDNPNYVPPEGGLRLESYLRRTIVK